MTTRTPALNAFQRRYFAWAQPHYERMPQPLRADVERIDRWLYSARAAWFWTALVVAICGSVIGLVASGVPWGSALVGALAAWAFLVVGGLGAWLQPERVTGRGPLRTLLVVVALGYAGALVGYLIAQAVDHGAVAWNELPALLGVALVKLTPTLLPMLIAIMVLGWSVARLKRRRIRQEVEALRLARERDAAARQIAEARLRLLQGQIQPHFIFNTLAAVQHWVDDGDPRAGPLLRSLTSFLRSSTELLTQDRTPFGVEADTVRHYLSIMQARLGERLRSDVQVAPSAAGQPVPPGLLLTLVENAIEHGIAPHLHGGEVRVAAQADGAGWVLRVDNDGAALAPTWQEGIGLANLRERLHHLFGGRASLVLESRPDDSPGVTAGTRATVRIASEDGA